MHHRDAIRSDPGTGTTFAGTEGILAFYEPFFAAVPDAVARVRSWVQADSTVAVEWTWSGTHTGDMDGWPATGKPFTLEGCSILELEDGLIRSERAYWDMGFLLRQA